MEELIRKQKEYLDHFFENIDLERSKAILEKLLRCKGSIIFSGVGKSGIIANKIAMTLLSTGTKAFYLPPMDALHGNIGIAQKEDIFIFFSRSGNSEELVKLVPFIKKRGSFLISILSDSHSCLAQKSDLFISLAVKRELCPFNMVPTTSTSIQLLFGDILAVALMEAKKFSLEEYAYNHPGGAIGKKIALKVEDLMLTSERIPLCLPESKLLEVLPELSSKQCGALIAVDEDLTLRGIFTDGDLRRSIETYGDDFLNKKMKDLMTKEPKVIKKDVVAYSALVEMEEDTKKLITVLPVVSDDFKVIGIIRLHDILQAGIKK